MDDGNTPFNVEKCEEDFPRNKIFELEEELREEIAINKGRLGKGLAKLGALEKIAWETEVEPEFVAGLREVIKKPEDREIGGIEENDQNRDA